MVEILTSPGVCGLLKPLQVWMDNPDVSEIMVNRPQEVFVEAHHTITHHVVPELTSLHLSRLCTLIANESQQILSDKAPLLSANLYDGSRVQIVLPPVAQAITLCIRKQVARNLRLDDYAASSFYNNTKGFKLAPSYQAQDLTPSDANLREFYEAGRWDEFIKHTVLAKKNIVISGGTASGKTTFLKACLAHISRDERIITLEDTREINLIQTNNVQLLASKGEQGMASITLQDLVQCALRLRPDRLVIGEIRGKEILDFVSSASTGHEGVLTTIHANNPRIAFMRMVQLYKLNNVPAMTDPQIRAELEEVIDIIVQVNKTATGRQVTSIYYKHGDRHE